MRTLANFTITSEHAATTNGVYEGRQGAGIYGGRTIAGSARQGRGEEVQLCSRSNDDSVDVYGVEAQSTLLVQSANICGDTTRTHEKGMETGLSEIQLVQNERTSETRTQRSKRAHGGTALTERQIRKNTWMHGRMHGVQRLAWHRTSPLPRPANPKRNDGHPRGK